MGKRHKGVNYAKYGYIFSIPFVLAFLVFMLYPLINTATMGFTDASGISALRGEMEVLDDPFEIFRMLITDNQLFRTSIGNTFRIWIVNFIPQVILALTLTAWFTNNRNKIKGQGLFKILFYMPNIITAGSIAVLFGALFAFPVGPVQYLRSLFGEPEPFNFLSSPESSRNIVSFIQFWMWYGYTMLILIAGVLGLNPEMYESSEIDGANAVQQFFFITLPNLKTILLFVVVTSIVGGITMFDIPMLFNDGGPVNSTTTLAVFIFRQISPGGTMRFNVAAAASILVFVLVAVLSLGAFYLMRDKDAAQLRKEEKALRRSLKAEKAGVRENG